MLLKTGAKLVIIRFGYMGLTCFFCFKCVK